MGRIYLYVPFEERLEVQRLGARWDNQSKCWFVDDSEGARFRKWLETPELTHNISSDEAFVASTRTSCWRCRALIEVVALTCRLSSDHRLLGDDLRFGALLMNG